MSKKMENPGGVKSTMRAKRRHMSQSASWRQSRLNQLAIIDPSDPVAKVSPHRFNKRKALNCGIPGCGVCANPRKLLGNSREALSLAEQSAFQKRLFAVDDEDV